MRVVPSRLLAVSLLIIGSGGFVKAEGRPFLPTAQRIAELAALLPASPHGIGAMHTDRPAWRALAGAPQFQEAVKQAEKLLTTPVAEMTDDLYLDFSRTGNRSRGERVLGLHQERLRTLVVAECCEDRGRFLAALEEAIRAICAEKSWLCPAHDRDLENFRGKSITIDLRAATIGWELATARYWLGDKLSPRVCRLIDAELDRRIFSPFTAMVTTGKPAVWWLKTNNNWNAVCLAGVVGAALTSIDSRERRAFFLGAMERSVPNYLSGITPDGYCSEGIGYWNYGFGHYVMLAEIVWQATGGKINMLADDHVRQIALFSRRIEILPGVYPAFADCHRGTQPSPELTAFLSRRLGWGLAAVEGKHLGPQHAQVGKLSNIGVYGFANSTTAAPLVRKPAPQPLRDWFSDAGVLVCRPMPGNPHPFGVAMKGGNNAEHHNHNDIGSFVVALGHATPLLDPGSEVYTRRTFSEHRYDSNVLNSFGHPVPRVAGQLQICGRNAAAKVLKTEFTSAADTLVLDIAGAYNVSGLKSLHRIFVFSREGAGRLTVCDEVEFDRPQAFGTTLITYAPWKQRDTTHFVVGNGTDAVSVEINALGGAVHLASEEIHEDMPDGRFPTRLGLDFTAPVAKAKLTLTIKPE